MNRIRTLEEIKQCAKDRQSLVLWKEGGFHPPTPAAWVYNMQAWWVHRLLDIGLYIYEPKPKRIWFKSQEAMRTALRIARKASPLKWTAMPPIFLSENSPGKAATPPLPASPPPRTSRSSKST